MKSPFRLLVILNGNGLSAKGLSGGDMRTYEIVRHWTETGKVLPHAVTTSGGLQKLRSMGFNWPITLLKASLLGKKERFVFYRFISYFISAFYFRFREKITPPAEVILTSSDFLCDVEVACYLKQRRPAIRWFAMIHHLYAKPWQRPGNLFVNFIWYFLQRLSLKRIASQADSAMVLDTEEGDRVKRLLIKYGMDEAAIFSMQNGFRPDLFVPHQDDSTKKFTGLFVGQLRPNKGIYDLVEIWRLVCLSIPLARLLIVGCGSRLIEKRLHSEVQAAGLSENIQFAGNLSSAELIKAYLSAEIFIAPSHEEGWGIAILEAMACGIPVVAYDLIAYQRHYAGAFEAIPKFDKDEFAKMILSILSDSKRAEQLSQLGLERSAGYDWSKIAERDWEFIESKLSNH